MPRRNYNAVQDTSRRLSPTHLLIDMRTNKTVQAGRKVDLIQALLDMPATARIDHLNIVSIHR